jgi:hypothetical protein
MWRLILKVVSGLSFVTGIVGWITLPDDAPLWLTRFAPVIKAMTKQDLIIALFALSATGFATAFVLPVIRPTIRRAVMLGSRIKSTWSALSHVAPKVEPSSEEKDIYLNHAILYLADRSEWGAWYRSQAGAPTDQMLYSHLGFFLTQDAMNGELDIYGRLENSTDFIKIDRKYWSLAALSVKPDVATIIRVRTMARGTLGIDVPETLPMYVGLHTDRARLMQLYPPKSKPVSAGRPSRLRARLSGSRSP